MKRSIALTVVGGDLRQACLAEALQQDGHTVTVYAVDRHSFPSGIHTAGTADEAFENAVAVILPLPLLQDDTHLFSPLSNASHPIASLIDAIPSGTWTLAGAVPEKIRLLAARNHLHLIDYLQREELAIRNAALTAEGAIQLAMEETSFALRGAPVLVIGNGRIGKVLSSLLSCLGAHVTVSARNVADFARIETTGFQAIDTRTLDGKLAPFWLIFNTVPHRILHAALLAETHPDCLLIDLASRPGGIDFHAAAVLPRRAIHALSLPGRVAPRSAALAIRDTIYAVLEEEDLI